LPGTEVAMRQAIDTIGSGGFDEYLETAYPTYVASPRVGDPVLKHCFWDMAHAVGPDAGLRQMRALLALTAPFPHIDRIACPTVILGGREDRRTTPLAHQKLARRIPGSRLVLVGQAAHFTPLEQPEIVTATLQRWIES
jgi:pimeloyl-ACP methyl ester carboxylesterase